MSNPLQIKEGERIRLVKMGEDPDPVPVGSCGTVKHVQPLFLCGDKNPQTQFLIKWDSGRGLNCICPPDIIERIPPNTEKTDH